MLLKKPWEIPISLAVFEMVGFMKTVLFHKGMVCQGQIFTKGIFFHGISLRNMNKIQKNFCKALKKYKEKHYNYRGGVNDLAKKLNLTQGHFSNVLAGRKCPDETWRREVAAKIGMDYDAMIGIEKPENNIVRFESVEDKQHYEITRLFLNKPQAIKINKLLAELEAVDPDKLIMVEQVIRGLKNTAEEDRKTAQKKREAGNDKT